MDICRPYFCWTKLENHMIVSQRLPIHCVILTKIVLKEVSTISNKWSKAYLYIGIASNYLLGKITGRWDFLDSYMIFDKTGVSMIPSLKAVIYMSCKNTWHCGKFLYSKWGDESTRLRTHECPIHLYLIFGKIQVWKNFIFPAWFFKIQVQINRELELKTSSKKQ